MRTIWLVPSFALALASFANAAERSWEVWGCTYIDNADHPPLVLISDDSAGTGHVVFPLAGLDIQRASLHDLAIRSNESTPPLDEWSLLAVIPEVVPRFWTVR